MMFCLHRKAHAHKVDTIIITVQLACRMLVAAQNVLHANDQQGGARLINVYATMG
jgi:hypothetical protein